MAELDIREGVIKLQDKFYKSQAVFIKDEYYSKNELEKICKNIKNKKEKLYVPDNLDVKKAEIKEEYKNYLNFKKEIKNKKDLKILKYRPYLKVVKPECSIDETKNILTFVLFNPSYANQYMLDETIKNCAHLSFDNKNYNGFEVLNLFCNRDSKVNLLPGEYKKIGKEKVFICDKKASAKENSYYTYEKAVFKDVVLACGYSKFKTKMANCRWQTINEMYKTQTTRYFELHRTDTNETKPFHFGNAYWSSQKLPFKKSVDTGKITLKQITESEILK